MRSFDDLSHVSRKALGAEISVLDTGALITPEAQAMLGAMYSRSSDGFRVLLEKLRSRGPEKFLQQYYVGYGHKSIGDLGEAAIFIDGVSMLAAKAIQDFPLYRGQESSTRYINFAKQPFFNHGGESRIAIQEAWRAFYIEHRGELEQDLIRRFPRREGEDEKAHENAIHARAFDIMRGFLPAGALTNLVWMGDLRHIADHLLTLRNHPLTEVRIVAEAIEDALIEKFRSSFTKKRYQATEAYTHETNARGTYFDPPYALEFELEHDGLDNDMLIEHKWALANRPPKTELPYALRECGTIRFGFTLDFGSYRDLQRHRAVTTRMPLLGTQNKLEPWYRDELPIGPRTAADSLTLMQSSAISRLGLSREERQYYMPMGTLCPIRMTGDLRALVYLVELRATRFVHPTLQRRAIQIADVLKERFGDQLALHLDDEPGRFDVRRGTHDIIERL